MHHVKRAREAEEENLSAFAATLLSWSVGAAVGKDMKRDQRAHIGIHVLPHVVKLPLVARYEVLEKHFEANLHRS